MNVTFVGRASVSNEARTANASKNKTLGLPEFQGSGRLAVVGGGPSIRNHIAELQGWDGDVWAVNGTINFCIDHQIKAAFYTIDASPLPNWTYPLDRVQRAVLSIECDPSIYAHLSRAQVSTLAPGEAGPTSAAGAALLGVRAGYREVRFFGCEASFADTTHAYKAHPVWDWIVLRAAGREFRTKPEFLDQTKALASISRDYPHVYSERSGGLLKAMIESGGEYELLEMSPQLWATVKEAA